MAPKSSSKTGSKRKRGRVPTNKTRRPASSKGRSAASSPLRAQSDPIRQHEPQEKRGKRRNHNKRLSPNPEVLEMMGHSVSAFLDLPMRMARCRTPFDVWNEQAQFLRSMADDYQLVALRMMKMALAPLPELPAKPQRNKR